MAREEEVFLNRDGRFEHGIKETIAAGFGRELAEL